MSASDQLVCIRCHHHLKVSAFRIKHPVISVHIKLCSAFIKYHCEEKFWVPLENFLVPFGEVGCKIVFGKANSMTQDIKLMRDIFSSYSMGWVPLNAVVINVVIGDEEQSCRSCRLRDRRDYLGLIEFVHRTRALAKKQEYSFVFDVMQEANDGRGMHFVIPESGYIVNSSASLSYAIEIHGRTSTPITLHTVYRLANSNTLDSRETGKQIAHAPSLEYIPNGRTLPDQLSPTANLKQEYRHGIEETATIPVAGHASTRCVHQFRGEHSPSTSANIGGASPHLNSDLQMPEEKLTRASDNLGLKSYGHGISSRQARNR